jgi:hypothetical protein
MHLLSCKDANYLRCNYKMSIVQTATVFEDKIDI